MRFLSLLSVVAANMSTAVPLVPGRYLFVKKAGKFRLVFDVYEDEKVVMIFDTPTAHFMGKQRTLTHQSEDTYTVTPEVAESWRKGIESIYSGVALQDGDLTTLTFASNSILYVTFEGRRLRLLGELFPLEEGTFVHRNGSQPLPSLEMSFTVQADDRLNVQFRCSNKEPSSMSLTLTKSDFRAYRLGPQRDLKELQTAIKSDCPSFSVYSFDLQMLGFTTPSTIMTVLNGGVFLLRKV
ncbi:hypothetical protein FOL47_002678 [Perkinsus chesapeaki]|uniref:Uncharacterized protein n=1 Tax=Perkinsus chesapeaki TaxID=330153 RepID=A0A7J6KPB8_PERCH|nr:hypothetical protein FOL47_002678 [Perkinsus chesapeaki]